jgi:hypothetical protein
MTLIDQFIHHQGLEAAFQFDLHDLLLILINIFWRAWDSANCWPYSRAESRACSRTPPTL